MVADWRHFDAICVGTNRESRQWVLLAEAQLLFNCLSDILIWSDLEVCESDAPNMFLQTNEMILCP